MSVGFNPLLVGPVLSNMTLSTGYTGYFTFGTSLGLDRPMAYILQDIAAALDPQGLVLGQGATAWNAAVSLQPCPPYTSPQVMPTRQYAYGKSWMFVTCNNIYAAGAGQKFGGVNININNRASLLGTLPVQLRELRTATTVYLYRNIYLGGAFPAAWCACGLASASVLMGGVAPLASDAGPPFAC